MSTITTDDILLQVRFESAPNQPIKQLPLSRLEGSDKFEALFRKAIALSFHKDDPTDLSQYDFQLKYHGKATGWLIDVESALDLSFAIQQNFTEGVVMMTATVVDKNAPAPVATTVSRPRVPTTAKSKVVKAKKTTAKHARPSSRSKDKVPVADKIVASVAEAMALGEAEPQRQQIALNSGYSNVTSKGFANALSGLKKEGLIEYPDKKTVRLTAAGLASKAAVHIDPPKTTEEVHERMKAHMKPTACKMFVILSDGKTHLRKDVALALGYTNETSKGFANALSTMSGRGIVEYPKDPNDAKKKLVRLTDVAFPFGRGGGGTDAATTQVDAMSVDGHVSDISM